MQVKDYLQALSDENKIHVEKIGSGNWYWVFANEELQNKRNELSGVHESRDKLQEQIDELEKKISNAKDTQRAGIIASKGKESIYGTLVAEQEQAFKDLDELYAELLHYGSNGALKSVEDERLTDALMRDAARWTEHIHSMEAWLKEQLTGDVEQLDGLKRVCYGDEYDEEEHGLKDLESY